MASELAARHQAVLEGFTKSSVTYDGVARTVYRLGKGPAVIVLPEVPGMTPLVTAFCRRVADAGFTVVVPSLLAPLVDRRQPSNRSPPSLGCASHASSTFSRFASPAR